MTLHDTQGSRIDPCSMFIHIHSYSSINEEAGSLNKHTLARFLSTVWATSMVMGEVKGTAWEIKTDTMDSFSLSLKC